MRKWRIELHEGRAPEAALAIRRRVFIEEQGVPLAEEMDGRDADCTHFVAWNGASAEGCARLRRLPSVLKVERVAVRVEVRSAGLGRALMDAVEAEALRRGAAELVLNAQSTVVGFYEKLGWTALGAEFVEAGIPHRKMEKRLVAR